MERQGGVPALTSSKPWTIEELNSCIERGYHHSATEHSEFLLEELSEFTRSGFWVVLPYRKVRSLKNLMASPEAVKDKPNQKPSLLCDHSWYPVDDTTLPHAPPEAMQFGSMLPGLSALFHLAHGLKIWPNLPCQAQHQGQLLPSAPGSEPMPPSGHHLPDLLHYEGEEQLIAIPLSCTMGWTHI